MIMDEKKENTALRKIKRYKPKRTIEMSFDKFNLKNLKKVQRKIIATRENITTVSQISDSERSAAKQRP